MTFVITDMIVAGYGGYMAYDLCFKILMLHVGMSGMPTVHQKY